jgi:hypothetical protein
MPSVVGLLEQREVVARRRVDGLREEADRIQAELAVAEREWREWAIARSRVGEVLAPVDEPGQSHAQADGTAPARGQAEETPSAPTAAKSKSQVPVWHEGLAWSVLSVDYPGAELTFRCQFPPLRPHRWLSSDVGSALLRQELDLRVN